MPGSQQYGHTPTGKYITEKEAVEEGDVKGGGEPATTTPMARDGAPSETPTPSVVSQKFYG